MFENGKWNMKQSRFLLEPNSESARHKSFRENWRLPITVSFVCVTATLLLLPTTVFGQEPDAAEADATLLGWLVEALGLGYILIFMALSFILVALFIMNILSLRRTSVCPPELVEGFEAHLDQKQYQEAYELSKTDESFLGNVLSSGLARLSTSYEHAIGAMEEVGSEEQMKLEHQLSYLALIGTLSPMIGLFGTVHGMISSFYTIATAGATPDPSKLAGGISTALLTTLMGLGIAIPAIAGYNILKNRVQRLVLEVGTTSENLMGRFEKVGKK